ncbi:hypothetical protein [Ferrovibrio sp.]|uniref:hypothetical protein n=1 Tax=Ferrovibrio sp. TaxID=1917215 RepID=UPI0035B36957
MSGTVFLPGARVFIPSEVERGAITSPRVAVGFRDFGYSVLLDTGISGFFRECEIVADDAPPPPKGLRLVFSEGRRVGL